MKLSESYIHVAMREFLKKEKWLLIAGEYPNGSDEEVNVLSISDPTVAKDHSPDPRRHSMGEIVPDLIAYKDGTILIIEAKPRYSLSDKRKLPDLLFNKRSRLSTSLKEFSVGKLELEYINYDTANYIPVLAFGNPTFEPPCKDVGFGHIYVKSISDVKMIFW